MFPGCTYSNTFIVDVNGTAVTMVAENHSTKVIAWSQTPDEPLIARPVHLDLRKVHKFHEPEGLHRGIQGQARAAARLTELSAQGKRQGFHPAFFVFSTVSFSAGITGGAAA